MVRSSQRADRNPDLRCQAFERLRLVWRHFRSDRAPITFDFEQPAVEDRIGNTLRSSEMDIPGEDLPGLMHETTAFVEEPAAILIDNDPVRIDQHDRRGIPGSP